MNCE